MSDTGNAASSRYWRRAHRMAMQRRSVLRGGAAASAGAMAAFLAGCGDDATPATPTTRASGSGAAATPSPAGSLPASTATEVWHPRLQNSRNAAWGAQSGSGAGQADSIGLKG